MIDEGVGSIIAKSQDVRDCIKIGAIAKTISDVEFIVDKFFGPKTRQGEKSSCSTT